MPTVFIIGAGNFGTALAKIFSAKNRVIIYSLEPEVIKDINRHRENKRYLPGVRLGKSITAVGNYDRLAESDIIFVCVPSSAVARVAEIIRPYCKGKTIISTSKGIDTKGRVMTEVISSAIPSARVLAMSGPSIASEIARGRPTRVFLAGKVQSEKDILETDNFIVEVTSDIAGVQLLGFYKNILAILIGLSHALNMGENFKASLISKAYRDFYYANIVRMRRHTFIDSAGLGDLYVTTTSKDSRNQRFGYLLGKGKSINEIKKEIGQTIEGLENLETLIRLKNEPYFDTNLIEALQKIVYGKKGPVEIRKILERYLRQKLIKNIIFDWGAVLTDGNYTRRVAGLLSKKYSLDQDELFSLLEESEKDVLLGKKDFAFFHSAVMKRFPEIGYDFFMKCYTDSITWNSDILDFIKANHTNYGIYVLSNNYSIITERLWKSNLAKYAKGMVFSNEVGMMKPEPEIFHFLIKKYSIVPSQSLFVDDSLGNVNTAKSIGFNTIHYTGFEQFRKDFALLVRDSQV